MVLVSFEEGGEVTEKGYMGASDLFFDLDLGVLTQGSGFLL